MKHQRALCGNFTLEEARGLSDNTRDNEDDDDDDDDDDDVHMTRG